MIERANLFAALAKAQAAAHGVEKSSENKHHKYRYASAEDVITESRRVLSSNDLAFVAMSYRIDQRDGMMVLRSRYLLTHASGEYLESESETPIVPGAGRPEDKAVATAKTYDISYQLRALLLLARVEEGSEVDSRDDTSYRPVQRPTAQEIQAEARESAKDQWPETRARWIRVLGRQMFADCVGCDSEVVDDYVPPTDPKKRAAVKAVLEHARREIDEMTANVEARP